VNTKNKFDVSIIIPCYKEEAHIVRNTKEIYSIMNKTNYSFEIIFVEDAGGDKTKEKIIDIVKNFPNVQYLFHKKNTGKGKAIADGAKISNGNIIGHIDIDLEISANYLPFVIAEIENGFDIALIERKINFNYKYLLRDMGGKLHRLLIKYFLPIPFTDVQSGCKFFKRDILLELLPEIKSQEWFFDVELMTYAHYKNFRIKQIPGFYIRNAQKKSTVNFFRDGIKQLKNLIRFKKKIKEMI
jgi:glycosyltransferase involved in cell wall biosynthesis